MSGAASKTVRGRFFEDFALGERLAHATPRTLTDGDRALYLALTGSRFALQSSDEAARALGYPAAPLDDWLVFHIVFGRTVPEVSRNAVANLGYADGRFHRPVFAGDTLAAESEVIGLKENSSGKTGTVTVRTRGANQRGETVVEYVRWVMVSKRDPASPAPEPAVPELPEAVPAGELAGPPGTDFSGYDTALTGQPHLFEDYRVGERIDHVDGTTVEEAEHQMATRLYQNTARVHLDLQQARAGRFGRRVVYGGHVISLARALSFNGLGNAVAVAALNGGRHAAPVFAGDTLYAWSEVLAAEPLAARGDLGALRLRTVATKDRPGADFPDRDAAGAVDPAVVLDLDTTVLIPRRG